VATEVTGSTDVKVGATAISFKAPYPRVRILDAIKEHTGHDLLGKSEEETREIAKGWMLK
jgi:lysyl-tRNA synthetase class 2